MGPPSSWQSNRSAPGRALPDPALGRNPVDALIVITHRNVFVYPLIDRHPHGDRVRSSVRKHAVVIATAVPNPSAPHVEGEPGSEEYIDFPDRDVGTPIRGLLHAERMRLPWDVLVTKAQPSAWLHPGQDPTPSR